MRLVVVGDTLLDLDLVGTASRLCWDAWVPVVGLERRTERAGGAGLTAAIAAADGPATLVTAVADHESLRRLNGFGRSINPEAGRSHRPRPGGTGPLVEPPRRCSAASRLRHEGERTWEPYRKPENRPARSRPPSWCTT